MSMEEEDLEKFNPLELLIQKPHFMEETCALKTTVTRLPPIEKFDKSKKIIKKKLFIKNLEEKFEKKYLTHGSVPKVKIFSKTRNRSIGRRSSSFVNLSAQERQTEEFMVADDRLRLEKVFSSVDQFDHSNRKRSSRKEIERDAGDQDVDQYFGLSKCISSFKVDSSELSLNRFQLKDEKLEEALPLKNWNLWLDRMKSVQEDLKIKLNKSDCDLALNQLYDYREVGEDKELLTIYKKWKEEVGFQNVSRGIRRPKAKTVKGKKNLNEMPPVEYLGHSKIIKKEKNLLLKVKSEEDTKKKCFFKEEKNKLKVHKPEMDELVVIGRAIPSDHPKTEKQCGHERTIPVINITQHQEEEEEEEGDPNESFKSIFCLVIDGIEIKYEIDSKGSWKSRIDGGHSWEIQFGPVLVGDFLERTIAVENRGTMAIEYNWIMKKPIIRQSLDSFQPSRYEPCFFFNKNSGIFLPGQKYDLKFYQRTSKAGVRIETWYLKTCPSIFPNDQGAKFVLKTVAMTDCEKSDSECIEEYLNERVKETTIRMLLNQLLDDAMRPDFGLDHIEYRALLSEKVLFEYHNPKHYYRSDAVKQLKELFFEVTNQRQNEWDLSLATLLSLVRTCPIEKRKKQSLLRQISHLAQSVLPPCYMTPKTRSKKFQMVYQVLCKMVNQMEIDYDRHWKCIANIPDAKSCQNSTSLEEFKNEESSHSSFKTNFNSNVTGEEPEIRVIDVINFYKMIYIKVYQRLCQAAEEVSAIIETNKNLRSWKAE